MMFVWQHIHLLCIPQAFPEIRIIRTPFVPVPVLPPHKPERVMGQVVGDNLTVCQKIINTPSCPFVHVVADWDKFKGPCHAAHGLELNIDDLCQFWGVALRKAVYLCIIRAFLFHGRADQAAVRIGQSIVILQGKLEAGKVTVIPAPFFICFFQHIKIITRNKPLELPQLQEPTFISHFHHFFCFQVNTQETFIPALPKAKIIPFI